MTYFQVYEVSSSNEDAERSGEGALVFENEELRVTYSLWDKGGRFRYKFYNKSEKDLFLDRSRSHFVINGLVYEHPPDSFYQKKAPAPEEMSHHFEKKPEEEWEEYSSFSSGPDPYDGAISIIPPRSARVVEGTAITSELIHDCDAKIFPDKEGDAEMDSVSFSREDSPLRLQNRLTYYSEEGRDTNRVVHELWVDKLINYTQDAFYTLDDRSICPDGMRELVETLRHEHPAKFYIEYEHSYPYSYPYEH